MTDTSSERLRLAMLVRELEKQLKQNMEAIFKPVIPHPHQVDHYFQSYFDYLELAIKFTELPNREMFLRRAECQLVMIRDNLGSLAGRIGELACALESSVSDILKERDALEEKSCRSMESLSIVYDGTIQIQNGDIVEIERGIQTAENSVRATRIKNLTQGGWTKRSRVDGTLMTIMPKYYTPPLKGKVRDLSFAGNRDTLFILEQGSFIDDHIFVPSGERDRAAEVIKGIFKSELVTYVKVCDPFITGETFDLLKEVPDGISIYLLYSQPGRDTDEPEILNSLNGLKELGKNIRIRKCVGSLHTRYILTSGTGWQIGHSLHDAGKKDTSIDKMKSTKDIESEFDKHWADNQ